LKPSGDGQPSQLLQRLVRALLPPAAREHVVGDLNERYRSPGHYFADALAVLPFIVASQVRRTTSVPRIAVRVLLLWFTVFLGPLQQNWVAASIPTALAALALLLRDAYRDTTPPPAPIRPRAALIDVLLIAVCALLYQAVAPPDLAPSPQLMRRGMPIGCALYFFMRLQNPGGGVWAAPPALAMSLPELLKEVCGFEAVWQRAVRIEVGLCAALIPGACIFAWLMPTPIAKLSGVIMALAAAFVSWRIHRRMRISPVPDGLDFATTVTLYKANLESRVARDRTDLWWHLLPLMLGPVLLATSQLLHAAPENIGTMAVRALAVLSLAVALVILTRRASVARFQKRIGQLATLSEK
jgi:hypothetical protein